MSPHLATEGCCSATDTWITVHVAHAVWWDLPVGLGRVYQDSGAVAAVAITPSGILTFGELPRGQWRYRARRPA